MTKLTCTKAPRAYIEGADLAEVAERLELASVDDLRGRDDGELVAGDVVRRALNLADHVELVARAVPGSDGTPTIVPEGCGHDFDFELDPRLWDVNTSELNGEHYIIERHVAVVCPYCGTTADHLSVPVDTVEPLLYVDKRERARAVALERILREDPDVAKWPADRLERIIRGVMGAADVGYAHVTEGAVALSAATAKSIIGAKAGAAAGLQLAHWSVGFDGVTATAVPVLVELCYATFATNSPGTNSTGTAERIEYGRQLAVDWTGGRNWTAEPTVLTVIEERLLTPYGGLVIYDYPLGTLPDTALAEGFAIRCNAPAVVNVRATQKVRRA